MRSLGLGITNANLNSIPAKVIMTQYIKANDFQINRPYIWATGIDEVNKPVVTLRSGHDFAEYMFTTYPTGLADPVSIAVYKYMPDKNQGLDDLKEVLAETKYLSHIVNKDLVINNHSAKQYGYLYDAKSEIGEFFTVRTDIMLNPKEFYLILLAGGKQNSQLDYYLNIYNDLVDSFKDL